MQENKPVACFCVQGGPGQSGSGYGNFELIGPRGLNFTRRSTNWVSDNIILFTVCSVPVLKSLTYGTNNCAKKLTVVNRRKSNGNRN